MLHSSFTIAWGILGVTILVLLPITNYLNIPKEIYITLYLEIDMLGATLGASLLQQRVENSSQGLKHLTMQHPS